MSEQTDPTYSEDRDELGPEVPCGGDGFLCYWEDCPHPDSPEDHRSPCGLCSMCAKSIENGGKCERIAVPDA